MSHYSALIQQTTNCRPEEAPVIENIMRTEIFHSTLDWQSMDDLQRAAMEAKLIYDSNKSEYDEARSLALRLFNEIQGENLA
jgi:hypothetical protein